MKTQSYITRPTRIRGPFETFERGDVVEVTARVIVPDAASPDQVAEWVASTAFGYGSMTEHNPLYGAACTLLDAPAVQSAGLRTNKLDVIRRLMQRAARQWRQNAGEMA